MTVLETGRLTLRRLKTADAPFIFGLVNEPAFLRHIGDKGVRNLNDARRYLLDGPIDCYAQNGFGMYLTLIRETGVPAGICGLLRREGLDHPDIGFAFAAEHGSQGFAYESALAVLDFERAQHGLDRILAITTPGNSSSIRLLRKLGFELQGQIRLPGEAKAVNLFASQSC